jgi:hypothetical protein
MYRRISYVQHKKKGVRVSQELDDVHRISKKWIRDVGVAEGAAQRCTLVEAAAAGICTAGFPTISTHKKGFRGQPEPDDVPQKLPKLG